MQSPPGYYESVPAFDCCVAIKRRVTSRKHSVGVPSLHLTQRIFHAIRTLLFELYGHNPLCYPVLAPTSEPLSVTINYG